MEDEAGVAALSEWNLCSVAVAEFMTPAWQSKISKEMHPQKS